LVEVAVPFSSFCWWIDALFVWLRAKSAKEATTIRQTIHEAIRRRAAMGKRMRAAMKLD